MLTHWEDGRVKMLLTTAGLRLRRDWPEVFVKGRYVPLVTDVPVRAGIVAFARVLDEQAVLFIAPRLVAPLMADTGTLPLGGEGWKTSRILLPPELHGRTFRNHLIGAEVRPTAIGGEEWLFAGQVFETMPVGILTAGLEPNP